MDYIIKIVELLEIRSIYRWWCDKNRTSWNKKTRWISSCNDGTYRRFIDNIKKQTKNYGFFTDKCYWLESARKGQEGGFLSLVVTPPLVMKTSSHPLTHIKINTKYFNFKPKFIGVFSRDIIGSINKKLLPHLVDFGH